VKIEKGKEDEEYKEKIKVKSDKNMLWSFKVIICCGIKFSVTYKLPPSFAAISASFLTEILASPDSSLDTIACVTPNISAPFSKK